MPRIPTLAAAMLLALVLPTAVRFVPRSVSPIADGEDEQSMAIPTPVPDVPPVHPSMTPGGLADSPAPAMPHYAPAMNVGPVTGYGAGGLAPIPGTPANPPYSGGGLGGRR